MAHLQFADVQERPTEFLEVAKNTVHQWLRGLGPHGAEIMAYHCRHLHRTACQLDAVWTFVKKQEGHLPPLEPLLDISGDPWVWSAFAPITKGVPAWVAGKRTRQERVRLLQRFQSRTAESLPFFTRDELPHDAAALLEVYGQTVVPPRTGRPGRPRSASKVPPDELRYAVGNTRRTHGRVVEVTTPVVYGTPARLAHVVAASPVSRVISTFGVERNNVPIRQHARRRGRKVHALSTDHAYLEHHLALSFAYYHVVVPHRGLRQPLAHPLPPTGRGSLTRWMQRTPAMAAGVTDHIWTMDELLSFRVSPQCVWPLTPNRQHGNVPH